MRTANPDGKAWVSWRIGGGFPCPARFPLRLPQVGRAKTCGVGGHARLNGPGGYSNCWCPTRPSWPYQSPDSTVPLVALIDDEYCCQGTVTIPVEQLDTYQKIPWGTPAWFARYANRNQIENVNGMLQSRGSLKDGWCRILNKTGQTLGVLVLAIAHNLRERRRYRHRQQ